MKMPVSELLNRFTSSELTEWKAFATVEPIGELRRDIRMATLASTIANIYRDTKLQPEPIKVTDFIHDFWKLEGEDAFSKSDEPDKENWKKIKAKMAEVAAIQRTITARRR